MKEYLHTKEVSSHLLERKQPSKQPPFNEIMNSHFAKVKQQKSVIQCFTDVFEGMDRDDRKPYPTTPHTTLHHLVSFETIKNIFAGYAVQNSFTNFWNHIFTVIRYYDTHQAEMNPEIVGILDGLRYILELSKTTNPATMKDKPNWADILWLLTWYPPNLVEGPERKIRPSTRDEAGKGDPGSKYDTEAAISAGVNNTAADIQIVDDLTSRSSIVDLNRASDIYLNQTPGGAAVPGVKKPTGMIATIDPVQNISGKNLALLRRYLNPHTLEVLPDHPRTITYNDRRDILQLLEDLPFFSFDAYIQVMEQNMGHPAAEENEELQALKQRVTLLKTNKKNSKATLESIDLEVEPRVAEDEGTGFGDLFEEGGEGGWGSLFGE